MRVAALRQQIKAEIDPERTGIVTSTVLAVSASGDDPIALFFTGRQHAGENLVTARFESRELRTNGGGLTRGGSTVEPGGTWD